MKLISKVLIFAYFIAFASCVGSNDNAKNGGLTENLEDNSGKYMEEDVNAIDQSMPQIMVIPSDNALIKFDCLKEKDGHVSRKYEKYLTVNEYNRLIVTTIQDRFNAMNFPLTDFEQSLKQLASRSAQDQADDLEKDAKTLLLETTTPDFIIEYDCSVKDNTFTLNISCLDSYTNKVVSTKTGIYTSEYKDEDLAYIVKNAVDEIMPDMKKELKHNFSETLTKGREVSLRFVVKQGSNFNLKSKTVEGETLADWIQDYMDTHSVKGSYRMKSNTANELSFSNVRIKTLNDDGTQASAYQWARECIKSLRKDLGVEATNNSQGLGDIVITIEGM